MNKKDYLIALRMELERRNVPDLEEIIEEYDEHFRFKLADGYAESEIAVKLGPPERIAAQFESEEEEETYKKAGLGRKLLSCFVCIPEIIAGIVFLAWDIVIAAAAIAFTGLGVALAAQLDWTGIIPEMPYRSALVFGICAFALAVLVGCAAFYCFAFLKQSIKSRARWHKNLVSGAKLPPLPASPQFSGKAKRVFRAIVHYTAAAAGVSFILAYVLSALAAKSVEFWHAWEWFV